MYLLFHRNEYQSQSQLKGTHQVIYKPGLIKVYKNGNVFNRAELCIARWETGSACPEKKLNADLMLLSHYLLIE